jgi:hypothetical protein
MNTDKQSLQVNETYLVWDGREWITMYDGMIQPNGKPFTAVESTHLTGGRMGWIFISPERRHELVERTQNKLNS